MIDLDDGSLETVRRILASHVPDCEVRVFGSRYHRKAGKYSDLDLALVASTRIDWRRIEGLKEAFSESDLAIQVDVIDINAISDTFRGIIEQGYEVIQTGPV